MICSTGKRHTRPTEQYEKPFAFNPYTRESFYDYHFMKQTNTGQWAEKHGIGENSIVHKIGETPDTIQWDLGGYKNYYNSPIRYFTISKKGGK